MINDYIMYIDFYKSLLKHINSIFEENYDIRVTTTGLRVDLTQFVNILVFKRFYEPIKYKVHKTGWGILS